MVVGVCNHSLKQFLTNAAGPMCRQDVKPPNSSGVSVVRVRIAIKPTNANHLTVSESEKQSHTGGIEAISTGYLQLQFSRASRRGPIYLFILYIQQQY
jgi:hypothetical protein